MSSDSDRFVFQQALEEQDNSALFQAKRVSYVVDSSSSGGVFNSQLQFDLNTLSSQNQWTDLSQGYVQFPVKVSITAGGALGTLSATTAPYAVCIKNGFHNFVDSVQLVLGGSTIQTSQIYTNVDTSFKILTEWSQDELRKYGPTLGIALDDYKVVSDNAEITTLDNTVIATSTPTLGGVTYPSVSNSGFKERCQFLNTDMTGTGTAKSIVTNPEQNGKGSLQWDAAAAANADALVVFYLATIRLKDLSDAIAKLPPVKNLKGYLYINYNAATSTYLSTKATGAVNTAQPVNQAQYGRCQPIMVERSAVNDLVGGADRTVVIKSEISGVASATLTSAKPAITNARLYTPYYVASPEVDRALAQKKTIRYNERFVTTVNIAKTASVNVTVSPGVVNPKRLILLPILTGDGSSAGVAGFSPTPELSPFDIAGCGGSSPFAALQQLQVYVGNQPMFQEPVSMDHQMFINELGQIGRDGGLDSETGSGLLSQRLWNQMYRYYTVDIGRRINGDDGASKSIQLSCYNPCNAPMRLICIVWYDREVEIDTALGVVTQGI